METLHVQLTHQNALNLLQELERLHIIRLIPEKKTKKLSLSERIKGKLSPDTANLLQQYIIKSRNEWERNI